MHSGTDLQRFADCSEGYSEQTAVFADYDSDLKLQAESAADADSDDWYYELDECWYPRLQGPE